jgi:hypothetical protein
MSFNPFLKDQATSILRKALSGLIPWLVATQLLDAGTAEQFITILAGLIVAGIWGFATGKFKREKMLTAQAMPRTSTEEQITAAVAAGLAPSVRTRADEVPVLTAVEVP